MYNLLNSCLLACLIKLDLILSHFFNYVNTFLLLFFIFLALPLEKQGELWRNKALALCLQGAYNGLKMLNRGGYFAMKKLEKVGGIIDTIKKVVVILVCSS